MKLKRNIHLMRSSVGEKEPEVVIRQGSGTIANISSIVCEIGNFGQTDYSASKAALIGFTKLLAKEVASKGITVNTIAPGFVSTEMTRKIPENTKTSSFS